MNEQVQAKMLASGLMGANKPPQACSVQRVANGYIVTVTLANVFQRHHIARDIGEATEIIKQILAEQEADDGTQEKH